MSLASANVSGAALAALTASLAVSSGDVDGLILGSFDSVTRRTLHDHDEATSADISSAHIAAFSTLATAFSYYDAAGNVDVAQLKEVVDTLSEPIIGCFTWRQHSALQPTMREQVWVPAVLHALRDIQPPIRSRGQDGSEQQLPMLFANTSGSSLHGGATTGFQCRTYQISPGQPEFQPLRLHINSIHSSRGYTAAAPLFQLPRVPRPRTSQHDDSLPVSPAVSAIAHLTRTFSALSGHSAAAASSAIGSNDFTESLAAHHAAQYDESDTDACAAKDQSKSITTAAVQGLSEQVLRVEELYWHLVGQLEAVHPDVTAARADAASRKAAVTSLHNALVE